jgi:hypothetical protein
MEERDYSGGINIWSATVDGNQLAQCKNQGHSLFGMVMNLRGTEFLDQLRDC